MIIPKFYNINDLLRQAPDGARIVPVSKATLHRMIAAGTFPKPRKLGKRSVWIEEDITLWREQLMKKETEENKLIFTRRKAKKYRVYISQLNVYTIEADSAEAAQEEATTGRIWDDEEDPTRGYECHIDVEECIE